MYDVALLLSQTAATALIAGWLTLGAWDNIRHPALNGALTAEVMEMRRMRAVYPADFARVSHRAITDPGLHRLGFRLVVAAEVAVTALLWVAVLGLLAALAGLAGVPMARGLALVAATGFTAIWAGFLIVGNYFCYWYCHEGAQNTHYQMTLWGLATAILIAAG